MLTEKLKYITIWYYNPVESVKFMIQEHYDTPEYDNTLFILNLYWVSDEIHENLSDKYKRIIYYHLEHRITSGTHKKFCYNTDIQYLIGLYNLGITEMWSMDYESEFALMARDTYNIPIKYMPVRYTALIKQVPDIYRTPKTIDCCHVGTLSCPHRWGIIQNIESNFQTVSFKFITSTTNLSQCISEMNTSKFIVDMLRDDEMLTQNQVRIFELLCMGYTVCAEKCSINMFPGLIYEWKNVDELYYIVKNNEYIQPTEAYKEMTYTDEAYEKYVNCLIEQWNTLD